MTNFKGYFFAAAAAASYGTNPIFAIPLYHEGMNVESVLFFRYLMAVAIMGFAVLAKRPGVLRMKLSEYGLLGVMGFFMVMSSITLFASYNHLSAGIASTLLFFYPVIVAIIMALFYGERMTTKSIVCLATAFAGVALLSKNEDGTMISLWGITLVMLSSLSYALYLIYINRGKLTHLPSMAVTFVVLVAGFLVLAIHLSLFGELTIPQSSYAWFNAIGLGLFPTVISLICTSKAIECIGSTKTAIFGAFEPLTAVALGIIILGETLTLRPAIGMVLIFVSVTILMSRKR